MKRILGLVICLLMLASMAIPAFAETNQKTLEAKKVVTDAITIDGQIDELWSEATEYEVTYVKKNYTDNNITKGTVSFSAEQKSRRKNSIKIR